MNLNLVIYSGDTVELPMEFTRDGSPADLSGASIHLLVSRMIGGSALLTQAVEITDAGQGTARAILSSEQTGDLAGFYHCEVVYADATAKKTVFAGPLKVIPTIKES